MLRLTHDQLDAVQRVLLPVGYHRFGYPVYTDNGYRATAQNVLDPDNLGTYAVNLPTGHGGLASVAVYNTPFGSKWQVGLAAISAASLGTASAPLVNRWVPSDAFTGGAGAPGTTTFDASACQAGSTTTRRSVQRSRVWMLGGAQNSSDGRKKPTSTLLSASACNCCPVDI